jgi:anti-sigma B factor antagonist
MSDSNELVRIERRGDVACIYFVNADVERTDLPLVEARVRQLIDETDAPKLVISFKGVRYISTVMLGTVIAINKWVRQKGGHLRLSDLSPALHSLFEVSGLTRVFEFHDRVESALKDLT